MKEARIYFDKCVALLLIAATLAVSCALPGTGPGGIDSRALTSAAGRVVDENLSLVREYIYCHKGAGGGERGGVPGILP